LVAKQIFDHLSVLLLQTGVMQSDAEREAVAQRLIAKLMRRCSRQEAKTTTVL
jgi:hypothetical protein